MLLEAVQDTYKTYQGDSGIHRTRLILSIAASIIIALLAVDIEKSTFQIASLVITVLTGFTFTALFSNYSVTIAGLPTPSDENDLFDLKRLQTLGYNFGVRSKLFIVLALIDLTIIMFISTRLHIPRSLYILGHSVSNLMHIDITHLKYCLKLLQGVLSTTLKAVTILVFIECIYTFYHLAETILAVIEIRKSYVETKISDDSSG